MPPAGRVDAVRGRFPPGTVVTRYDRQHGTPLAETRHVVDDSSDRIALYVAPGTSWRGPMSVRDDFVRRMLESDWELCSSSWALEPRSPARAAARGPLRSTSTGARATGRSRLGTSTCRSHSAGSVTGSKRRIRLSTSRSNLTVSGCGRTKWTSTRSPSLASAHSRHRAGTVPSRSPRYRVFRAPGVPLGEVGVRADRRAHPGHARAGGLR